MLNRIILIGRLVRDPELRTTPGGKFVANFTLAVDRGRKDASGKKETDFIDIIVWEKQAENVSQYLKKGSLCAVEGRLQIRSYTDRQNNKRKVAEVVASSVQFLDSKKDAGNEAPADDDDVPF